MHAGGEKVRKILLFAVLLLTLTLLPTVPIVAKKPPPTEERYYVTFDGPDITSEPLELMSQSACGKGGKHLALLTPQTCLHPGKQCTPIVEYTNLTFVGVDVWNGWTTPAPHVGKIRLSINLQFNEVDMIYFFDYEHDPLDFWRLINTDDGKGKLIQDDAGMKVHFENDPFEIWLYSNQGDITTLYLTFNVTITEP